LRALFIACVKDYLMPGAEQSLCGHQAEAIG
jgi:hypothetical protein